jgi:spore maturation protein CgeB
MRIFYASDTTPNAKFASNIWRSNLYLPLVDLGHDVVEFRYDLRKTFRHLDHTDPAQKAFIAHNRPRVSEALLTQIRAAHAARPLDLFFSYFFDACVLPETIEQIKRLGITTVNWYCNGSYQLHLVAEIAPHYDWCLVPEKFRIRDYERMGARPLYCQEAANPAIYQPFDLPVEFDVTFVGQAYGERPHVIKRLSDDGIDVRVWGYGWERYAQWRALLARAAARQLRTVPRLLTAAGGAGVQKRSGAPRAEAGAAAAPVRLPRRIVGGVLDDLQMIQMYSRSKINLGFSACGDPQGMQQRILQIRLRDFEVPMSRGFYLVEYMEELEEFFRLGEEVVCYRNAGDLVEKIKYYLRHDGERERIRQAGYERCRRDHTWHRRFQTAFRAMGLE